MKRALAIASLALVLPAAALAQTNASSTLPKPPQVIFPIADLGNCGSKDECKAYCDIDTNKNACYTYAQSHGLMTKDEVAVAKKLLTQVGPGGCKGDECKNYCGDPSHAQVCLEFAKANGFISKDEAAKRAERLKFASTTPIGSSTMPLRPPVPKGASTTPPTTQKPPLEKRLATSTDLKGAPGRPSVGEPPKPLPQASSTGGSSIDYSRPPYHCTPPQAEEGACDPDQLPGYVPPPGSEQGGSVWLAILHLLGL